MNKLNPSIKIALIGNPNSGKSSLFNLITGLKQKVGNYPGVTVDKKVGTIRLSNEQEVNIIDFPGLYSFYPNSTDEKLVINVLTNPLDPNYPDYILCIIDSMALERHLLLATQLIELGIPMGIILTMSDILEDNSIEINQCLLETKLGIPVIKVNNTIQESQAIVRCFLDKLISNQQEPIVVPKVYQFNDEVLVPTYAVQKIYPTYNSYQAQQLLHHSDWLSHLNEEDRKTLQDIKNRFQFQTTRNQVAETLGRFNFITQLVKTITKGKLGSGKNFTDKIDEVLTHKIFGPAVFFVIMGLVFHIIFSFAEIPMNFIEISVANVQEYLRHILPQCWWSGLITDGLIAGLGGIVVFIPQIALLFLLIGLLEDLGYMARVVFMFDSIFQRLGLNGRSIVALISGGACAIPAIMSTRTISNWKERLITILVTPLISCSARIPVYTVLIGLLIPGKSSFGLVNAQAFVFGLIYLLSILMTLFMAFIFKLILKSDERSYLMIEMPQYKKPSIRNLLINVQLKVRTFVFEAGKVIIVISVLLWFLASYAPGDNMIETQRVAIHNAQQQQMNEEETTQYIASQKLENSYAGLLGKIIEPVIRPLGFDWKIGIALITSFAAREVFVGTISTIYSIGSDSDDTTLREKMALETNSTTGLQVYSQATTMSLILFYVFALQCMSTVAVTYRETKSWKWPAIQLVYSNVLAYLVAFAAYQILS